MKLSEYAKNNGVTYQTAWNHFRTGKIVGAYQLPTGTVVIPESVDEQRVETVVYARVSSSQNKDNLKSQASRLEKFCSANGWKVDRVVCECASGLNDKRPKLLKLLTDPNIKRIVVEHKDRLTRFGYHYIAAMFDGEIIVVNQLDDEEKEIIEDLTSIITSFCARIYGHRRSKRKTEAIINELSNE